MDVNNFRTLGECDFGTIWYVEGENRVVVNAYQAALYFSVEDFAQFARMVGEAERKMSTPKPTPAPAPATGSKIRQFRPQTPSDEE
ncbi:hypothetical protein D3C87_699920 [compost metagenome]